MLRLRELTLVVMMASVSAGAIASGSFSGGSGVGIQNSYNLGKSVFHKKLVCSSCVMAGQKVQAQDAKNIINKLKTDGAFLSDVKGRKRTALITYLKKRY